MNEVSFRFKSQEELEGKIAYMLRRCGWQVTKGVQWETPKEVQTRFGIQTPQTLTMRLRRYRGHITAERGPSGRIIRMQVDPLMQAYFEKLKG